MKWYLFSEKIPPECEDVIVYRRNKEGDDLETFLVHYNEDDELWHCLIGTNGEQFIDMEIKINPLPYDKWSIIKYPKED